MDCTNISVKENHNFRRMVRTNVEKMLRRPGYKILLAILGAPTWLIVIIKHYLFADNKAFFKLKTMIGEQFANDGVMERIQDEVLNSEKNKVKYLDLKYSEERLKKNVDKISIKKYKELYESELQKQMRLRKIQPSKIANTFCDLLNNNIFLFVSIISSAFMYVLIYVFSRPYLKYICERLFMMLFVMMGVTFLVFTILYISPSDPARNILGEQATPDKIKEFKRIYGLDKPYLVQLFNTFKKFATFNLGNSYVGNEDIMMAISRRFPITVQLSFASLLVAIVIAIPSGIISAIKQYSSFDYLFMLIALIGLSIPNFWLGLILILNFSIKLGWLPAMYDAGNAATLIMPAIVLGTGLSATVARMTRSSMLEVKNQDYILTARAKGLSERRVILKHILGNAMIPIITVVGLQLGGLLGGSSVTEKVFNVNGLGKYIVEKQFIPDIPVVMAGVVYIAIVISIVNLLVDILYAFLDPRIKSKIKNY